MKGHIAALGGLDGVMDWDDYYGTAVHLWDVNTQKRLGYIIISRRGGSNNHPLTDLALNHDGSILITAQNNGAVRFWNTSDDSEIPKGIQEIVLITRILYNVNEKYLALQSAQGVSIWDTETREKVSTFNF